MNNTLCREQFTYLSNSTSGLANINATLLGSVLMAFPPLPDQERISNFLDDKTARIEALIAEKERLLAAMQEHVQAQISGLLLNGSKGAALVSTGRPFVAFAPEHWRVVALKRALVGMNQGWSPQCESRPAEANEWGVLKVGCVNGTTFNAEENKALPPPLEPDMSCQIRRGDVLVSRANTLALVGSAALVDGDYPNLFLCDKLYRLDLKTDWLTPEFAVLLIRSGPSRFQIELGAGGASSSMQNISQDVLRELIVALPPIDEQLELSRQAKAIRAQCDSLVSHIEEHIDRLREYRSSLISAAVTGQLDVGSFEARS
ncbi:restriction endonuclease subunit S [Roseateles albus]|uniref:Type I restriction modification DNA specificity domain-containing protein n=1 Tax=Roseateles albus TaxID=2987525 RepID=A0ABT5KCW2_9BURK|nr:hypothetical protein [Roseateles albus]MDC8771761.1 hypothetical protein [Roseateles albus]